MSPDERETSLVTNGTRPRTLSMGTTGDVPGDFPAIDHSRGLSPTLESVVLIPKASTLVLDPTVPTLNPLEDSMEPLNVEPPVLVLAPKAPTHVLTPKASTLDPLEDLTEPLIVEPSVCVLAPKAPTPVLTPKGSTLDPIKDPTEPLNVEPSVPLNVDAPVDPNGLVSAHGDWVIMGNVVDSTGVVVKAGTRRGPCGGTVGTTVLESGKAATGNAAMGSISTLRY